LPDTEDSKKSPVVKVKKKPVRKRRKKRAYKQGDYTSTKTGKSCKYRSGWELKYFEHLDQDPDVIDWESEPFTIPYVSNKKTGRIRRYIPDIIVRRKSTGVRLEEIKPRNKMEKRLVARKLQAGHDWAADNNILFVVITEVELKALGLL
jgi:hypothetical protein